jgi:hypothetical protein
MTSWRSFATGEQNVDSAVEQWVQHLDDAAGLRDLQARRCVINRPVEVYDILRMGPWMIASAEGRDSRTCKARAPARHGHKTSAASRAPHRWNRREQRVTAMPFSKIDRP